MIYLVVLLKAFLNKIVIDVVGILVLTTSIFLIIKIFL